MCVTNWRRSLESVKDLKRQNLNKEVLPLLLSWLPQQNDFRTFCMSEDTEKMYQKLEELISVG